MKSLPTIVLSTLLLGSTAFAQEQEAGMLDRIMDKAKNGVASPMQNQEFNGASGFAAKEFSANSFSGVKDANVKEFSTKSFFGIKNPWFGKEVYESGTDRLSQKTARASDDVFSTDAFDTAGYTDADKDSGFDKVPTPRAETPREFAVFDPFKRRSESTAGLQEFTDTFQRDLSIEEVRALLNKGQD